MKKRTAIYVIIGTIFILFLLPKIINAEQNNDTDLDIPIGEIELSTTEITSQSVTATLTVDKEIETPIGWNMETNRRFTKTYNENQNENIKLKELKTNNTSVISLNINNIVNFGKESTPLAISEDGPKLKSIDYSITTDTKEDVVVTVHFDDSDREIEYIQGPDDWNLIDPWG